MLVEGEQGSQSCELLALSRAAGVQTCSHAIVFRASEEPGGRGAHKRVVLGMHSKREAADLRNALLRVAAGLGHKLDAMSLVISSLPGARGAASVLAGAAADAASAMKPAGASEVHRAAGQELDHEGEAGGTGRRQRVEECEVALPHAIDDVLKQLDLDVYAAKFRAARIDEEALALLQRRDLSSLDLPLGDVVKIWKGLVIKGVVRGGDADALPPPAVARSTSGSAKVAASDSGMGGTASACDDGVSLLPCSSVSLLLPPPSPPFAHALLDTSEHMFDQPAPLPFPTTAAAWTRARTEADDTLRRGGRGR